MANNGRTSDGKFAKGNKLGGGKKQDFTKEMAQHVTSQELYWAARMATQVSVTQLKAMSKSGQLGDESLMTYSILNKAVKGDFKPMQFLIEMILGKAKQQLDHSADMQNIQLVFRDATEADRPTIVSEEISSE